MFLSAKHARDAVLFSLHKAPFNLQHTFHLLQEWHHQMNCEMTLEKQGAKHSTNASLSAPVFTGLKSAVICKLIGVQHLNFASVGIPATKLSLSKASTLFCTFSHARIVSWASVVVFKQQSEKSWSLVTGIHLGRFCLWAKKLAHNSPLHQRRKQVP